MRVEGAARKANVHRTVVAIAFHELSAAAHYADRKPAAERLAIGHEIGPHAEVFLCAARRQPEAEEYLVEDQRDAALCADGPQFLEPGAVPHPVEAGAAPTVDQGGVRRRCHVRIQALDRVDEHAGDVGPRAQHVQRSRGDMSASV